jgi:hypothetical protein
VILVSSFVFAPKSLALSWEQVASVGLENDPLNVTLVSLVEFDDWLYASVGSTIDGVKIFRSQDGITWTQANASGFGDVNCYDANLYVFNDAIYAGTFGNLASTARLYKSTNGTIWTQVGTNGFGDNGNIGIVGMTEFNNHLYFGTNNAVTGSEVFRYDGESSLVQVNTDGYDGTATNASTWSLTVFDDALYAGIGPLATPAQIWKSTNGTSWDKIMDGGFGDTNNTRINSLFVFNQQLYAGTLNLSTGTEVWRRISDTSWEQVNTDGFGDANNTWTGDTVAVVNGIIYLGTRNDTTGGELFLSTDGSKWTKEGIDGFGDADNYAIYAITFNGRIYLGFSSLDGAEVWRTGEMGTLSIAETSLDEGTVGDAYTETLSTNNGTSPMGWSVTSGSLPDGISLNAETGELTGTPTKAESFTFTVAVADAGAPQQLASSEYTIRINEKAEAEAEILPETGGGLKHHPFYRFFNR